MNTASFYTKAINRSGRDLINRTTGETIRAILKDGEAATAINSADVSTGQILEDPIDGKTYLVVDVVDQIDRKLVFIFPFRFTATIFRKPETKDDFGFRIGLPETIASNVPVFIHQSKRRIQAPIDTDVHAGYFLVIGSDTYKILTTSRSLDWPGLLNLVVK